MAEFKVIEKTLPSGSNILEVTDAALNNDSIFEVYTDDVNVIPVGVTVSGTTASITFDSKPTNDTGVKIFINNLDGTYNPIEISNNMVMGDLLAKIKVNDVTYEIHRGEIKPEDINYFSQYHIQGITQKGFNDEIEQDVRDINSNLNRRVPEPTTSDVGGVLYHTTDGNIWKKLDSSDVLYDEQSTLYSAMGDIDSLSTTSKNLVGAINEVASSGGVGEIIDVSDSFSTTYTIDSKSIEKYGKLVIGTIMMYCNTNIPTGANFVLGQITYKPTTYIQFMSPLPYLSQGTQKFGHYTITTSGNIRIRPNFAINSGDYLLIRFSYLTND